MVVTEVVREDGLLEDYLPAWQAWLQVSGQWRSFGMSGMAGARIIWLGLDYGAAEAALRLAEMTVTPETWSEVRLIEEGATEELNRGR